VQRFGERIARQQRGVTGGGVGPGEEGFDYGPGVGVAVGDLLGADQVLLADRLFAGIQRADAGQGFGNGLGLDVLGTLEAAARVRLIWRSR
jgi:hypothetical protein